MKIFHVMNSGETRTRHRVVVFKDWMSEMNSSATPVNKRLRQNTARPFESKAVFRSKKTETMGQRSLCLCSKICHKMKTWSIQSRSGRKLA